MARALQLAALGLGHVSPNPMVGCVIVKDHKIIGEGYHEKFGEAHAEVNAVARAKGEDLSKATVYVTLEPCAHFGNTPPCTDLLIEKNFERVVIASRDPFDKVDGKGIVKLKNAGIQVSNGILKVKADQLNARYHTRIKKHRPYIILKWAQSADGFLARKNFDSKWISNTHSRQLVHKWRSEEDAILVGFNTAKYDNPKLTVRDWNGEDPIRILIDTKADLIPKSNLLDQSVRTLVFTQNPTSNKKNVEFIELNNPQNDLCEIVEALAKMKIQSIIVEGGSKTLNKFIEMDLWDEARIFTANSILGDGIPVPKMSMNPRTKENVSGDDLSIYFHGDH